MENRSYGGIRAPVEVLINVSNEGKKLNNHQRLNTLFELINKGWSDQAIQEKVFSSQLDYQEG